MLNIGILDLLVIYLLPLVFLGLLASLFFLMLFLVVKKDIGKLAFSEDVRTPSSSASGPAASVRWCGSCSSTPGYRPCSRTA